MAVLPNPAYGVGPGRTGARKGLTERGVILLYRGDKFVDLLLLTLQQWFDALKNVFHSQFQRSGGEHNTFVHYPHFQFSTGRKTGFLQPNVLSDDVCFRQESQI